MAKRYFHVSRKHLGASPTLKAKVPETAGKGIECLQTPRVCFAPTVPKCLWGITGHKNPDINSVFSDLLDYNQSKEEITNPSVYATQRKLHQPKIVSDYAITGEMWSLEDIAVKHVGFVDMYRLLMTGKVYITTKKTTKFPRDKYEFWQAIRRHSDKPFKV